MFFSETSLKMIEFLERFTRCLYNLLYIHQRGNACFCMAAQNRPIAIDTITYNIVNNTGHYLNEIFEFAPHCSISTRNNVSKLKNPFRKTNMGQKAISYIGPSIWNSLPDSIKRAHSLNTFKHSVKKHYLTWTTNNMFT